MKINYNLVNQVYSYEQLDENEAKKLNFLLTNNKGDFLNMGINGVYSKFQGLNICNPKNLEIFKILDEIILEGIEAQEIEYDGYSIQRKFSSKLAQVQHIPASEVSGHVDTLGDDGKLVYNENGILEEQIEKEGLFIAQDKFFMGPSGGFVYEIFDYEGKLIIDLDMKKQDDFDTWGRNYNVYEKDGILFIEYTKKSDEKKEYKLYLGIKAINLVYNFIKDFVKKEYFYSAQRNSLSERYVYRLLAADISGSKRFVFGAGFNEEEVKEQILLLDMHQTELEKFDKNIVKDIIIDREFKKPITQDIDVAYKLSTNALYNFLHKKFENETIKFGSFAGYPWFANIWSRDELVGARGFINLGEEEFVKELLYNYLNLINLKTGTLPRIEKQGSLDSADGVFWLAKRFEDFVYSLEKEKRLSKVLTEGELEIIYSKFYMIFEKLVENCWDKENELLKVKKGDSWMDTIDVNFPLDIQVQFLEYVSFLTILAQLLGKKKPREHLSEFEHLLKLKIKHAYFRDGVLYDEPFEDKVSCNIFLAYYFYPGLFNDKDWEQIIDNALSHLKADWGGITSLSKRDSRFKANYTGENNESYHMGDSWFWINNIAAIVMNNLNEKKYRGIVSKILLSSTNDILKMGTIGFASELSSASSQKAEGSLAQYWSSSTYIEMIDWLFEKK